MQQVAEKNTFKKSERLCRRSDIEYLLSNGKSFTRPPFRVYYVYHASPQPEVLRIAISVPKRRIKKAVNRNRIKRLIKECFRLQKKVLTSYLTQSPPGMDMLLVYTGDLNITFTLTQDKIILILQRLKQVHEKAGEQHSHNNDQVL